MAIPRTSAHDPFQDSFHTVQETVGNVKGYVGRIKDQFNGVRNTVVNFADSKLPESYAYLVRRIADAVPEVFAALGAFFGGILVLPALAVSWGRKIEPSMPLIMKALHGQFSSEQLADGLEQTIKNFKVMFDRCLVPAFFVAMTIDTVASFIIGYATFDLSRMLHATTIALPGALLAAAYMLKQKEEEDSAAATPGQVSNPISTEAVPPASSAPTLVENVPAGQTAPAPASVFNAGQAAFQGQQWLPAQAVNPLLGAELQGQEVPSTPSVYLAGLQAFASANPV